MKSDAALLSPTSGPAGIPGESGIDRPPPRRSTSRWTRTDPARAHRHTHLSLHRRVATSRSCIAREPLASVVSGPVIQVNTPHGAMVFRNRGATRRPTARPASRLARFRGREQDFPPCGARRPRAPSPARSRHSGPLTRDVHVSSHACPSASTDSRKGESRWTSD